MILRIIISVLIIISLHQSIIAQCNEQQHAGEALPLWLYQDANELATNNTRSAKLHELLALRVGPNIQASSDYHDFQDIHLNESLEAWHEWHERARHYAHHQVNAIRPHLIQLLTDSNVSASCTQAALTFLNAAQQMDEWAIQMWSSSGSLPPVGLLDGHFTDLGSYRGCIDATTSTTSGLPRHPASYCLVGFRPVVPSRVRFHQIFRQEDERIGEQFGDVFVRFAQRAQYFHYLYLKTGVCVPVECGLSDLQQVSSYLGQRWSLMSAPIKCFTRSTQVNTEIPIDIPSGQMDNQPVLINLTNRAKTGAQVWALVIVSVALVLVVAASLWHALELLFSPPKRPRDNNKQLTTTTTTSGLKHVAFDYLSLITNGVDYLNTKTTKQDGEIKCLHGLRAFTMVWIICVHTLQYNDWSGFSRAFENEASLQNPAVHPLINANYVVDNFFLMSGLLASYTIWNSNNKSKQIPGTNNTFSAFKCLLGRYLRLTPQVALISLLNILLPLFGDGPFWYDMTHQAGRNCELNWWVNLLHLQAFYRADRMCNLVGWWISVDMFYYLLTLALLYLILTNRTRQALTCTLTIVFTCMLITTQRHYEGQFTPNNLATVPQIGEVWTEFVVNFVWTPYPHAPAFFSGLWLGWAMAQKKWLPQVRKYSTLGWLVSTISLVTVNYSSRLWVTGYLGLQPEYQFIATGYNLLCVLVWAGALGWFIIACHYGCAPEQLNNLLATKSCILLSKASFIIYLSHMLLVRAFYGSQYNLLEVSLASMLVIIISMVVISILFGVFLCIAFEGPCLKFHRFVMLKLRHQRERSRLPVAGASYSMDMNHTSATTNQQQAVVADLNEDKIALHMNPTSVVLLK